MEGDAVHIFFTKLSFQLKNQEVLFKMPGDLLTYEVTVFEVQTAPKVNWH